MSRPPGEDDDVDSARSAGRGGEPGAGLWTRAADVHNVGLLDGGTITIAQATPPA